MAMSTRRSLTARAPLARGRARAIGLGLAFAPLVVFLFAVRSESAPAARAPAIVSTPERRWSLVHRVIAQDQGDWQVDYRLRLDAGPAAALAPGDLAASVDGWVSNSRVPAHAVPRRSSPKVEGAGGGTMAHEVIGSTDEAKQCRERLVLRIWSAAAPEPPPRPKNAPPNAPDPLASVEVAPGGVLCVRIRLEHEHFLYGAYDPLLGHRAVELKLGPTLLRDTVPLDREHYLAQAKATWPEPPEDRRDTRHFISGPDSLHLEAHINGNQYFRFPDRPVRYGTRMKLSYWYLVAPGGEEEFHVKISQYKEGPNGFQILSAGASEVSHGVVGRWTRVERIVRTEPEATSVALDFKICNNADVGEVWIDDVKLEPAAAGPSGP
jgi:hypothetical protein